MKRTKTLCVVTSVLMAVLLVALSVSVPIGALDTITTSNQNKIDATLKEKMAEASDNQRIPVYIWYTDIDHDLVEKEVKEKTNLTLDDLSLDMEMPMQKKS